MDANQPPLPQPVDYSLPGVMRYLQNEWQRNEKDRIQWDLERAEMKSRLAKLEGEKKGLQIIINSNDKKLSVLESCIADSREIKDEQTNGTASVGSFTGGMELVDRTKGEEDENEEPAEQESLKLSKEPKGIQLKSIFDPYWETKKLLDMELSAIQETEADITPVFESRQYLANCLKEVEYIIEASSLSHSEGGDVNSANARLVNRSQYNELPGLLWEETYNFQAHLEPIKSVVFMSPNSLATASYDGTIVRWHLDPETKTSMISHTHRGLSGNVTGMVYDRDTRRLFTAETDGHIRVWDENQVGPVIEVNVGQKVITDIALTAVTRKLAVSFVDGLIQIYDVSAMDFDEECLIVGYKSENPLGNQNSKAEASVIKFILHGKLLVVGYKSGLLEVLDASNGAKTAFFPPPAGQLGAPASSVDNGVSCIAHKMRINQQLIFTGYESGLIRLYDLDRKTIIQEWYGHENMNINSIAIHAVGGDDHMVEEPYIGLNTVMLLATCGSDHLLRFWDEFYDDVSNQLSIKEIQNVVFEKEPLCVAWYDEDDMYEDEDAEEDDELGTLRKNTDRQVLDRYYLACVGEDLNLHMFEKRKGRGH